MDMWLEGRQSGVKPPRSLLKSEAVPYWLNCRCFVTLRKAGKSTMWPRCCSIDTMFPLQEFQAFQMKGGLFVINLTQLDRHLWFVGVRVGNLKPLQASKARTQCERLHFFYFCSFIRVCQPRWPQDKIEATDADILKTLSNDLDT